MSWNRFAKAVGLASLASLWVTSAAALPNEFAQEGLLVTQDGDPVQGAHTIRVRLWNASAGGVTLHDETFADQQLVEGYYFVGIGSTRALNPAIFSGNVWIGITIDAGAELAPRIALRKVPAAMIADNATGDITPRSVSVGGRAVIDANGNWVGPALGLQGPIGPAGPAGPVGPAGPAGAAGVAGQAGAAADPAAVVPLVVQNLAANPAQLPYVRKDAADQKAGDLTMNAGNLVLNGGALVVPAGAPERNAIQAGDQNAVGFNALRFNDPGPNEGLFWDKSQASIVVSPANGADADGLLRLRNDDGISLESPTNVTGPLTATTATVTNLSATNATLPTINGPVTFTGNLALQGDVDLGPNTDFTGTLRAGTITATGTIAAGGAISSAQGISAAGSVTAGGNVASGAAGQLRAGTGGLYINNVQIFDGNGNQLVTPVYSCPQGQVLLGTTSAGAARCASLVCAPGSSVRGLNADGTPICEADDVGNVNLPANQCPPGQALVSIAANGVTTCAPANPLAALGNQACRPGAKVIALAANGAISCDCSQDAHCPGGQYCDLNNKVCAPGCRGDGDCPGGNYCRINDHSCQPGCRQNADCPGGQTCSNNQCLAGVMITGPGEAYGHHGACDGWNQCGSAQQCALWACNVRGFGRLVSFGRNGPCGQFNVCHLFYSGCCGGIQWNWGNWCGVAGVSEIMCN